MKRTVQPLEILLATKMLGVHEGLLNSDRRIACILLDHFNRCTGRLDPGISRLAELTGLSERTVMRSIVRLVRFKLFVKIRHGGYSNRNRYEPNWALFDELRNRWKGKFSQKSRAARESVTKCHTGHLPADAHVTQTYSSNRLKQTCSFGSAKKEKGSPSAPTLSRPSSEASLLAAHRRWDKDLLDHYRGRAKEYAAVVEVIDKQLADVATEAEFTRRGAGVELILRTVSIRQSA